MRKKYRHISLIILLVLMESGVLPEFQSIGFYCNDPKISHTYTGDTISLKMLLTTTLILPLCAMLGMEYGFGRSSDSKWGRRQAILWYREYLSGYLIVFFLTCVSKVMIGEPRPHFLDSCKPYEAMNCTSGYVPSYICSNQELSSLKVRDASKSFPSGHASLSVFMFTFTAWYIHRRVVGISAELVAWMQVFLLTWTLVCCMTRITDHRHHWWDVLAGCVLGASVGSYTVLRFCNDFKIGPYCNLSTAGMKNASKTNNDKLNGERLLTSPSETTVQGFTDSSSA